MIKKICLALFALITQIHRAMEAPLNKTQSNQLQIVVSTIEKANIHLLLDKDANVLELKEKIAATENISAQQQVIYLIKNKFWLFQKRSYAISDIQRLKDIIEYHKTNKFLVCIKNTPSK